MLRFMTALMGALLLMQSAFADTVKPEIGKYVFGYLIRHEINEGGSVR